MSSNFTLFTSDSSSQSTGNAFDQDAFQDISLAANSNMGLTDNVSTNPMGAMFANDDAVRVGAKTLYIKDLVLISDHGKWVNGKPTYQIIWNENYPQAQGYVFGNIQITRGKYISIRQIGDGIGVTGVLRKCAFLVTGDTSATATAQFSVDASNTTTVDFSNEPFATIDGNGVILGENKYNLFVNSSSNQSKDIHDYRLTSIQTATLRLVGVVVYSENSGANVDVFQGTTYVNKNRVATSTGATLSFPSYVGNLGGRALFYKTQQGGYTSAIQPAPNLTSVATGSTGTNLLTVTTGTGASFPTGSGIAAFFGSTGFVGSVTNQSTDTLTVSPTLSFGISGLIYKTWASGQSLAINSSQLILSNVIDIGMMPGFSNYIADPNGNYHVWGNAIGFTTVDSIWPSLYGQNVSLGFIQVDGFFSGADIEFVGQGILHATFSVNGRPAYGFNSGQTGSVKKTVFTDAGPGWNSFNFTFGASYSGIGINKINLFQRASPQGLSNGLLATLDTISSYVAQANTNATFISQGTYHRYFSDQLFLQGGWLRTSDTTAAGGIRYAGFSTNCALNFQYYGKNFAILGLGISTAVSIDGGAITALTFNTMNTISTEGFHTVAVTNPKGSTNFIHAIDITRTQGEIFNVQNNSALPLASSFSKRSEIRLDIANGYGAASSNQYRRWSSVTTYVGSSISYTDDANNGGYFTILEDGLYSIVYSDNFNAANSFCIAKNPTDITAQISSLATGIILSQNTVPSSGEVATCSCLEYLKVGDVIRANGQATTVGSPNNGFFSIKKVA